MKYDASPTLPLELAAVEACLDAPPARAAPREEAAAPAPQRSRPEVPQRRIERPDRAPSAVGRPDAPPRTVRSPAPVSQSSDGAIKAEPVSPVASDGTAPPAGFLEQWADLVKNLSRSKGKRYNIGALLRDCREQSLDGDSLVLTFSHKSHLERMQEELDDPMGMRTVNDALVKSMGTAYRLKLTLHGENGSGRVPASTRSPLVRAALSMGARIVEENEQ